MAIIFTKFTSDVKADLRVFKFAYQFWLEANSSEACANLTLCLENISKDTSAKGFSIYFPFQVYDIVPNSNTLLDKSCPLNRSRGQYEFPRDESRTLPKLDGVPDVRVDMLYEIRQSDYTSERLGISQADVVFKKDIEPGGKVGVRIAFKTKGVVTNVDTASISFLCKIFDMQNHDRFVTENNLETREIKVQCYYDWDSKSGGFDPIIFYPQEYDIKEAHDQYDSVVDRPDDLSYNYLGETVGKRYKKATWRAWQILNCTKDDNVIGYKNYIQWFCTFQDSTALGDTISSLREEVRRLTSELEGQRQKRKFYSLLSVVLGLASIVLGILALC